MLGCAALLYILPISNDFVVGLVFLCTSFSLVFFLIFFIFLVLILVILVVIIITDLQSIIILEISEWLDLRLEAHFLEIFLQFLFQSQ